MSGVAENCFLWYVKRNSLMWKKRILIETQWERDGEREREGERVKRKRCQVRWTYLRFRHRKERIWRREEKGIFHPFQWICIFCPRVLVPGITRSHLMQLASDIRKPQREHGVFNRGWVLECDRVKVEFWLCRLTLGRNWLYAEFLNFVRLSWLIFKNRAGTSMIRRAWGWDDRIEV